jgi:hypothetical protein
MMSMLSCTRHKIIKEERHQRVSLTPLLMIFSAVFCKAKTSTFPPAESNKLDKIIDISLDILHASSLKEGRQLKFVL